MVHKKWNEKGKNQWYLLKMILIKSFEWKPCKTNLVGVIFVVLIVMVEIIQGIGFWGMESREVAIPIVGLELEVETSCNL